MDEAVNTFIRRRKIYQIEKWVMRAIMAEAFLIALWPFGATVALALGIVFWLVRLKRDPDFHFRHLPFDVPISVFVVVSGISVLVSPDIAFSFYNYYNLVGVYVFTYILVGQNIRTRAEVKKLLAAMAGSALLVVLYGFYQYLFGIDIGDMRWVDGEAFPELRTRVFSTWENPNILAGYLDAAICVILGIYAKTSGKPRKVVLAAGMVLLALCLAMTYARGACLTLAMILVAYGIMRDWRVLVACVLGSVVLLLADSTLYGRLASVFTTVDTSTEMRWAIWESTVAMIEDHPFFGIGWGAFWMVYPYYDFYLEGADVKLVHAHNIFLNYLAEIGVVGTLAFFWYFFGTMRTAFGFRDAKLEEERQALVDRKDRMRMLEMRIHDTSHMLKVKKEAEEKRQADEEEEQRKAEEERRKAEIDEELAILKAQRLEREEKAGKEAEKQKAETVKDEAEKNPEEAVTEEKAEASEVGSGDNDEPGVENPDGEKASGETEQEVSDKGTEDTSADEAEKEKETLSEKQPEAETAEAEPKTDEDETADESVTEAEAEKSANATERRTDDETAPVKTEPLRDEESSADSKEESRESEKLEKDEAAEKKNAAPKATIENIKQEGRHRRKRRKNRRIAGDRDKAKEALSIAAKRAAVEIANMEAELKQAKDELSVIEKEEQEELSKPEPTYEEAVKDWEPHALCEGASFGIGLAFVSVILNGLTDDLLFNIPTSMLLWFLAALAVCIPEMPKEDPVREGGFIDEGSSDNLKGNN